MRVIFFFCFTLLLYLPINSQETIAIPDIGLEECLIDLGIDSNGLNGSILVSDANYVVNLNINDPITNKLLPNVHSKVKDLTGLDRFPNLKRIDCFGNNITKIDLSKSTSITFLNCSDNQIESLDLRNNTELIYVSCDNNDLTELIIGKNENLESLYCSFNRLSNLDVKGCTKLESLDTTNNEIDAIIVNDTQLKNTPQGWYKDDTAIYTKNINTTIQSAPIIQENKQTTLTKTIAKNPETTINNKAKESTANYYEKFQSSVVTEYDKLILDDNHLQNKKNELVQKYNLAPKQLNEWITKYSNLLSINNNRIKVSDVGNVVPNYSNFKRATVNEYEKLILNPSYLQSKKEEIQKKYNLNSLQFTQWINKLGTPSLKAKTTQTQESTEDQYNKFKKSVVNEYDSLVLNPLHLQNKKKSIQQKYNITAIQLNDWINKYSKVKH